MAAVANHQQVQPGGQLSGLGNGMQELPRFELVLSADERTQVKKQLAKAIVTFQDQLLQNTPPTGGSLCQVWLPEFTDDGNISLQTKNLPFCVAGMGDLLALFRCISCRYSFGTDVSRPESLGAPGRVFLSNEPEASRNVQKYSKEVYLRSAGAQQCKIHSTLLVPLYCDSTRSKTVGVLEVVQSSEDMHFGSMINTLSKVLQQFGMYTYDGSAARLPVPVSAISMETPVMDVGAVFYRMGSQPMAGGSGSGAQYMQYPAVHDDTVTFPQLPSIQHLQLPVTEPCQLATSTTSLEKLTLGGSGGGPPPVDSACANSVRRPEPSHGGGAGAAMAAAHEGVAQVLRGGEEGEGESDEEMDDGEEGSERRTTSRGRGAGNPGKPGKKLRLEDLQSQFGVGLKEAAAQLGICPTTLKRACRRHGIQRWPRRQLMKISKAIDQIQATTGSGGAMAVAAAANATGVGAALKMKDKGDIDYATGDDRWTCLAQLIPGVASANLALSQQGKPTLQAADSDDCSGDVGAGVEATASMRRGQFPPRDGGGGLERISTCSSATGGTRGEGGAAAELMRAGSQCASELPAGAVDCSAMRSPSMPAYGAVPSASSPMQLILPPSPSGRFSPPLHPQWGAAPAGAAPGSFSGSFKGECAKSEHFPNLPPHMADGNGAVAGAGPMLHLLQGGGNGFASSSPAGAHAFPPQLERQYQDWSKGPLGNTGQHFGTSGSQLAAALSMSPALSPGFDLYDSMAHYDTCGAGKGGSDLVGMVDNEVLELLLAD